MFLFQYVKKRSGFRRLLVGIWALLWVGLWGADAFAISIKEEEQLSKEFFKVIRQQVKLIDDPLINEYVDRIGRRVLAGISAQPFEFQFYVIDEEVYNAFAIPAGHIFINSGLLMAMSSEDELAGILSHEISHVVCRHISQRIERSKKINAATLAGVIAGLFLGAASGNAAVTESMMIGSMAAGQTAYLGFSREDEAQADQIGLAYLGKAGYSAQGLLDALQKIRSRQWFGTDVVPSYLMTHPAVEQRIVDINAWMDNHPRAATTADQNDQGSFSFRRMVLRLRALYGDTNTTEQFFRNTAGDERSQVDLSYGYALLLSRLGRRDEAETQLRKALARRALDPVLLTELGRLFFMDGRYSEAASLLSGIVALPGANSEAKYYLARTRLLMDQAQDAALLFEDLLANHRSYQDIFYYMGEAQSRLGNEANAHYFLGLFYYHRGDFKLAFHHLGKARAIMIDPDRLEAIKSLMEEIQP